MTKSPADEGQQDRRIGPKFSIVSLIFLPAAIYNKLTGRVFNSLETTLFDAARKNLPPDRSRVMDTQLREFNLVQRHHHKRYSQSIFYRMGFLSIGPTGRNLMEFQSLSTTFATIDFSVGQSKVRAQLIAECGQFMTIEYNRNVKAFEHSGEISVTGFDGEPVALDPDHHRARPISATEQR